MKNIVLDSNDITNKIRRISFEIIEKNIEENEIFLIGILPNGKHLSNKVNSFINQNSNLKTNLLFIDIDKKNYKIKKISPSTNIDKSNSTNEIVSTINQVSNYIFEVVIYINLIVSFLIELI